MDELEVKYALYGKAIAPQPIRLKVGEWSGAPQKMVDGSEPQPWHCLPFVEGSTYGLELVYPYETECHVVGRDGTIQFDWDFAKEPGGNVTGAEFVAFAPRNASKYYFFNTSLDVVPPPGHVIRTEPHPRYFTDDTGTVPLSMIGHLQNEWYPRQLFVVFRAPRQGQRHIFRKNEPFAQLLFVPQHAKYKPTVMGEQEKAERHNREMKVGNTKAHIADNTWRNSDGIPFNNHYKVMARAFGRDGLPAVDEAIGQAVEKHKQSMPADLPIAQALEQGKKLMADGQFNEAAAVFGHVLQREPNNADAVSRLAIVYFYNQMPMVAIKLMSQAAALQPSAASHQADLGQMLQIVGRHAESETAYRAAIRLNPTDPQLLSHLGLAMAQQGRAAEGLSACQAALSAAPRSPVAHCRMGMVLATQNRFVEARLYYQNAITLDPNYPDPRQAMTALPPAAGGVIGKP